ncbi:MAG: Dyp-type peroxidase [Nannocystaceae bacterium]|nr:Dyp-type peroxidase [bacterium]
MLDLRQIQSNVLRGYRYGTAAKFVHYTFVRFTDEADARALLERLLPQVTSCEAYDRDGGAQGVLNIALAYPAIDMFGYGGQARALDATDDEATAAVEAFKCGMRARAKAYLGDDGSSAPDRWEAPYRDERLHAVFAMNAPTSDALQRVRGSVDDALAAYASVVRVHDEAGAHFDGEWAGKEHFGFADGIAQPSVLDAGDEAYPGDGTPKKRRGWSRLRSGEFVLGQPDELGQVQFRSAFFKNGSFMVFRKLQQHVGLYRDYVRSVAERNDVTPEFVGAKMVGRWQSGAPLMRAPDEDDPELARDPHKANDFRYCDDEFGDRCPLGAHIRRNNPREDPSGPGVVQTKLHRIIRRATPYGPQLEPGADDDGTERGTLFVVINANIARQFEFVQRNWVNSVLSSTHLTFPNDRDPLIGAQHSGPRAGKYLVPNTSRNRAPLIAWDLPRFVTTRGGEYFLLPSLDTLYNLAHDVPPPPEQVDCPTLDSPDARPDARPDVDQSVPRRTSPAPQPACVPDTKPDQPSVGTKLRAALKNAFDDE